MTLFSDNTWILLPVSFVLGMAGCLALIPFAYRLDWVDQPDGRKAHEEVTPLVGGVGIFAAMLVVLWPFGDGGAFPRAVLAGALLMLVLGFLDDRRSLSPALRLLLQAVVCLGVIAHTGVRLDDFGRLLTGEVLTLGALAIPVTVFAAMGVVNAFNLIDGMDGLSGMIFLVAAGGMALFAALAGEGLVFRLLLSASGAVAGFLVLNGRWPWNPRARTFLGNSGALALGFVLAWSFIRLGNGPDRAFMPMTAVWLFAVPLLDTSTLIWLRWRAGRSAVSADQRHLHHAFLRAGFSVQQTLSAISLIALTLGAIGIVFEFSGLPGYLSFYGFMVLAFGYYFCVRHAWAAQRFLGRDFIHHDFEVEEVADWRKPVRN